VYCRTSQKTMAHTLQDRMEIDELLNTFGWIMDHGTPEEMRSQVFTEDGKFEMMPGNHEVNLEDTVRTVQGKYEKMHHVMSNKIIKIDGDTASAKTYLRAMHMKAGGDIFHVIAHYVDVVVRTPEGWRIKVREFHMDFSEGTPAGGKSVHETE